MQNKMVHLHPIHEANEDSPYGDMNREEFYKKHKILHQESFILNNQNMKIFTQSWRPADNSTSPLKGLVAMIHGYVSESSWLFELTAVAVAKAGYYVCALDLPGHGFSGGHPGHIPDIRAAVDDCTQFFDSVRANHPNLPAFLYGESLGGAIAILICLKQRKIEWKGLIISGAMCGVSSKMKPAWPLEKLLPAAAFIAPTWKIVITRPAESKSYREEWKRKLAAKSPNRPKSGKPTAATAMEFLRVCKDIKRKSHGLEVAMLMLHGGEDRVCDPNKARLVYEAAASKDKSFKIFPGMGHQFIREPNETVDLVFGTMLSWIEERAASFSDATSWDWGE